jgi:hypothetical protein
MVTSFRHIVMAGLALVLALPTLAIGQDINLASGGADQIWKGTQTNAKAGFWLDLGDISGDGRRDLIAGAPGNAGLAGKVYVILGGPERTGEISLANAEAIVSSSAAGNLFGYATAAGNIINLDGTNPKNLAIGAPGANGGRGAVYLYVTGWGTGTTKTTADATFTVLGAPNDQLGTALATGDLDNDGRRELIIGAPGTNRVYIIKGSATLSGTLDLATASASATLTAAGLGRVLLAGDVTGDGTYDLLVGAPTQNVVYGYVGTTGTIPTVPAISFSGAAAGDEAGASVRLLDLDADGSNDVVIGAPGGDGPSNGRSNAGNVYVFFGPVTAGAKSLSSAHAVFYGASANFRAGDRLANGDINRDTPNDLVILASGASGGAGELDIYYGRARTSIGTLSGPTRIVDMGVAGQVSRRIFGDPAAGAIGSMQVYEVTGEGARDVIVGVPSVDGNTGKLFFTISPRLRISRATEALTVNKGGSATSSTAITVTNPSVVVTGWQATSSAAWLSASPSSGSVVQSSPGSLYIIGQTSTIPGGVHTGTLNITATSPDLTMTLPIDVTFTVTDAKLAIDIPANNATVSNGFALAGWAVDLAASSGTGIASVEAYAFPNAGGSQIFLGTATYGGARNDIGSLYGSRFTNSGYGLTVNNLTPGASYRIVVFAKSTLTNAVANTATVNVTVSSNSPGPQPTPTDPNPTPLPDPTAPGPGPGPGPSPPPVPTPDTRVTVNRARLTFGATSNGSLRTGAQTVTVSFTNGAATWSVASNAPWLNLSPASGSGAGSFSVTLANDTYPAGQQRNATLTVTAPGVANSPLTIPVTITSYAAPSVPLGLVDTPTDNVTGVIGSLPVTGWAVDDIGITRVTIWRDPLPGEPASSANGKVFIGNANLVDGARPDVDATYTTPFDYRAGWGYLLLTNMLPNQGNGAFRLHAYANDAEGNTVLLGSRTITCDNANATKPFGSIDTPDQGGTVSGTNYVNFGWALAPQPNSIPTNGSTITVFIDGVPVGHPVYNNPRSDIATLFPGRANTNGAIGYLQFDTTRLANGVHTIAWGVADSAGNAEGIGSRYFTVLNGASSTTLSSTTVTSSGATTVADIPTRESAPAAGEAVGQSVTALEPVPVVEQSTYVQKGFSDSAPMDIVDVEVEGGSARVKTEELGLVRIAVGPEVSGDGGYEGYMIQGSTLGALPAGSFLDRRSGEFFWQPGPGFVGSYDFVFVRTGSGAKTRSSLSVDIAPRKQDSEVFLPARAIRIIR